MELDNSGIEYIIENSHMNVDSFCKQNNVYKSSQSPSDFYKLKE